MGASTQSGRLEPVLTSDFSRVPPALPAGYVAEDRRELLAMAIGPNNQARYLRKFEEFERAGGPRASWHWPAFFFTLYWLFYRKLWVKAVLFLVVPYVVLVVGAALLSQLGQVWVGLYSVVFLIAYWCLPAIYADGWLYGHCSRIIEKAQAAHSRRESQLVQIARSGQTSSIFAVLVPVFVVMGTGMIAAIALPAYQDYTVRAKVSEAVRHGSVVAGEVAAYYEQKKRLPRTLAEAGIASTGARYLQDVLLDESTGTVTLVMSESVVAGKTVLFVPARIAGGNVGWRCQAGSIASKYLPKDCR